MSRCGSSCETSGLPSERVKNQKSLRRQRTHLCLKKNLQIVWTGRRLDVNRLEKERRFRFKSAVGTTFKRATTAPYRMYPVKFEFVFKFGFKNTGFQHVTADRIVRPCTFALCLLRESRIPFSKNETNFKKKK